MADATLPEGFDGFCDDRFAEVPKLLAQQIAAGEHHGVAFAAYLRGEPVIDVWGGHRLVPEGVAPWQRDTMALCWSTTKGITATAVHVAMERHGVSPDTTVSSIWPEFGCNGKEHITIRHVLSHEAGVPQIRDQVADATELLDWEHMVSVMEGLEPLWEPGTANGYHAINFAWLAGETLRRIDGRDVPTFIAEELSGPLGLDGLYIGTPASEHHRIAPQVRPKELEAAADDPDALTSLLPPESITGKALTPPGNIFDLLDSPVGYASCIPSISGVFTARSLAKVYAALERGGEVDGVRILKPETVEVATAVQNDRNDLVIFVVPRWRLGYMSAGSIPVMGPNLEGYGHVGLGGTYACADPKAGLAFALIYDKFGETELLGAARGATIAYATVAAAEAAG